jgi:hypothetical protein
MAPRRPSPQDRGRAAFSEVRRTKNARRVEDAPKGTTCYAATKGTSYPWWGRGLEPRPETTSMGARGTGRASSATGYWTFEGCAVANFMLVAGIVRDWKIIINDLCLRQF